MGTKKGADNISKIRSCFDLRLTDIGSNLAYLSLNQYVVRCDNME